MESDNKKMVNIFIILGVIAAMLMAIAVAGYKYYSSKTVREGFSNTSIEATENKKEILEAINLTNTDKEELKKYYLSIIEEKDEDISIVKNKIEELLNRIDEFKKSDDEIIKQAFSLFVNREYDDAISLLNNERLNRKEIELADVLMLKADLQVVKYQISHAVANMEKAVSINPSVHNKMKLNSIYEKTNNYAKALKNYEYIIENQVDSIDNNLLASIYQNMAVIYTSQNRLNDANEFLNKSIKLQSRDELQITVHQILSNVNIYANKSDISLRKGNFEMSLSNINKAIDYQNKLIVKEGVKHKMKKISLQLNKGIILSEIGDINELNDALEIYNRIPDDILELGLNHNVFDANIEILSLIGRANLYHKIGQYNLSIKDNKNALLLIGDVINYNPFYYEYQKGKIKINLGNSYKEIRGFENAELNIKEGISIYEKFYNKDPNRFLIELLSTKEALGTLYLSQGKYQNASIEFEELSKEMDKNFEESNTKYTMQYVRLYYNMGVAYQALNNKEKAVRFLKKSRNLVRNVRNRESPFILSRIEDMTNRINEMEK